jgi:GSH-dependent disulfide-bond oxidoreductase
MAIWPWYGNIALGRAYGDAATFLDCARYTHLMDWAHRIDARPAVKRGRMVNRTWGAETEQVPERHSAADFVGKSI